MKGADLQAAASHHADGRGQHPLSSLAGITLTPSEPSNTIDSRSLSFGCSSPDDLRPWYSEPCSTAENEPVIKATPCGCLGRDPGKAESSGPKGHQDTFPHRVRAEPKPVPAQGPQGWCAVPVLKQCWATTPRDTHPEIGTTGRTFTPTPGGKRGGKLKK